MTDNGDTQADFGDETPVAVPFGDKHTTDRAPTEARYRRVLAWARQQVFRGPRPDESEATASDDRPAECEPTVQVAIEKAETASLGRWVLWNPALTLLVLLTLPVKLYKRRKADRFDNSRRAKMLPEAVAADLDLPVTPVDLSGPERYRRQGWVVTLWAWAPVVVAGAAAASLGWVWAVLLGFFVAVTVGFWSFRRHSRLREHHMAGEIAALAADGPVAFFVGDSHVDPICEALNEAGVATARHPDSRYATATAEAATVGETVAGDGGTDGSDTE